jgi:hypothetical protein
MQFWELNKDDLFVWDHYPDEVHKKVDDKTGQCVSVFLNNKWCPVNRETTSWNEYARVERVRMVPEPV